MKEYVKPTFEYIELRPEERLACGLCHVVGRNHADDTWYSTIREKVGRKWTVVKVTHSCTYDKKS